MSSGNLKLFGRIAVAAKLITVEQLNEGLREQARLGTNLPLGKILVELGFITPEQCAAILRLQKKMLAEHRARAPAAVGRAKAKSSGESSPAPAASESLPTTPTWGRRALDSMLRKAVEAGASDVHIHAGAPICLRVLGELVPLASQILDPTETDLLVLPSLDPAGREALETKGEHDFSYDVEGLGRFRANVYRQLRGTDGSFRYIPPNPPTLEQLGLPSGLARFTNYHQGMVLLTGPSRCGKSSTLAALVNLINEERSEHILTIEDPIEYLHPSKHCLVNQRSVRQHTESFARALRAALREDPDVIVIGELRDRETIALAMSAAETGHFVLGTIHTDSAVGTINRLVGAFPPDQQDQVRAMLSESLKAVISQRLVRNVERTALVPAIEVMVVNRAVGNMIRDNKTLQITSLLQIGSSQGMCLLDASLAQLVSAKIITREDALSLCEDSKHLPEADA